MRRNTSILVLFLCLASGRAVFAQGTEPALEPPKSQPRYIIQPNDVLMIFVYKEPTLSGKVTVLPDGTISFPLVQDIHAAGLSPGQLKARIETALKDFIDVPNVTVQIDSIQSYKVYVIGKVARSGEIKSEKPINIMQALSLAGGFQEFANQTEVVIIRNSGEDSTLYKFSFPDVIKGRNFSQNMLLKSGDVVAVQ
jgi:polysaccharide export outer membrane protein